MRFQRNRANEQRLGCLDEGFEVTDNSDDLKDDQHTHEIAHQHHSSTHDDDVDGVEDEDGEGAISGDLTPNDIFGLDPLDVLTLEELAEYLKVSPAAAHRVIKELKLPGRNIGGEWRFLRDAVANWLRGQEAPAQQQQKAREDYSKAKPPAPPEEPAERFARPPQRPPYQADQGGGGGEYRPRQRFPEGGQQYGNQGGGQYGNRGGQYGGGQYGGGEQGGGNYGGSAGGYSPPPRRPFRAAEGGGQGQFGGGAEGGGYRGGNAGGARFGGGGYSAGGGGGYAGGGQRFGDASKRKNKRQVFDNERGKRLDRRREGEGVEGDVEE